jgi:asparagine synthase (glutamine-hydrolysing)
MTAVAGCVGPAPHRLKTECDEILRAQAAYGGAIESSAGLEGAFFGASLTPSLPEDRFDRQPLTGGTDRYLLVADVRLDNRDELALALNLDRRDRSDSEVLLEAWLRWQEGCLDRLVGDYAIAVWDSVERRLTLARDPTGQRPLHFASNGPHAAFASMPSGLLAVEDFRRGFNRSQLALMLTGTGGGDDTTYFSGIRRVMPGHVVQFAPTSVKSWRHWHPPQNELRLSQDDHVDAYLEKLQTAVQAQMRRDSGGVSVHLSSGFDSSAVAAMAARLSGDQRPVAFTSAPRLGFQGPVPRGRIADESGLAALTAQMHRMEHIIVRSDRGALTGLRNYCRLYQEPHVNLVNMAWARQISEDSVGRGAKVLLTGEMGNLSINAGGLPALAELIRTHQWGR